MELTLGQNSLNIWVYVKDHKWINHCAWCPASLLKKHTLYLHPKTWSWYLSVCSQDNGSRLSGGSWELFVWQVLVNDLKSQPPGIQQFCKHLQGVEYSSIMLNLYNGETKENARIFLQWRIGEIKGIWGTQCCLSIPLIADKPPPTKEFKNINLPLDVVQMHTTYYGTNSSGESLMKHQVRSNLNILNEGNKPTIVVLIFWRILISQ
jgi:hypothetical protein